MSGDDSSSKGWKYWIGAFFAGWMIVEVVFFYIFGGNDLSEVPWWVHLLAPIIGIPVFLLVSSMLSKVIELLWHLFTYFGVLIIGAVLLIFLIRWDLRLWICLIGVGFLVVGYLAAIQANKASKPRKTDTPDFDVFLESPERYAELIRIDEQEARKEARKAAAAWAFNSLGGYLVGVAMIIAGIVTFFTHMVSLCVIIIHTFYADERYEMNDTTRVTLVLPAELWEDVKRLVPSGQRSKMVAEAIEVAIRRRQRLEQLTRLRSLHERLSSKYGILPDSAEDIQIMREQRNHGEPDLH